MRLSRLFLFRYLKALGVARRNRPAMPLSPEGKSDVADLNPFSSTTAINTSKNGSTQRRHEAASFASNGVE
jgi:hypothetical protein